MSNVFTAQLQDGLPGNTGQISVRVEADGSTLSIYPEGYGEFSSADGYGCPVFLELYDGQLRLVVFPNINVESPRVMDLNAAKESCRRPED